MMFQLLNFKIIIVVIIILAAIGIIASGSLGNFEDNSENITEPVDDDSTGRIITRGLSESVGLSSGNP